jgi:translation initiation factor IF-2
MTDKVSVKEIADELGIASKDVLEKAKSMGIEVKAAQSKVSMEQAEEIANYIMNGEEEKVVAPPKPKTVKAKSDTPEEEAPKEEIAEETPKVETTVEKEVAKEETPAVETPVKEEAPKEVAKAEVVEKESKSPLKVVTPAIRPAIKRSGLKIVKKKKPKVEENYNLPTKQASVSSYGKMSAEVLEELAQKKKSKQSSRSASKQDQGRRMDIFGGTMSDVSMDMDDQVTLLDLNSTERAPLPDEAPRKPRPPKPAGRNANKKQAPRSRKVRKDKRKKYAKATHEEEIVTHVEIPEDIRVY